MAKTPNSIHRYALNNYFVSHAFFFQQPTKVNRVQLKGWKFKKFSNALKVAQKFERTFAFLQAMKKMYC